MALGYTIREGLAGFKRARFATATATSAMAVALVLVGLFAVIGFEAHRVTTWLRQHASEMDLFLEDTPEPVARALHQRVLALPGVAAARYITKAEAQEIFKKEFGEEGDVFLDEPFLPASIHVQVESGYANTDSLKRLAAELGKWNHVDEVVFNQPLLIKVQQNLSIITLIGVAFGLIITLAAVFLVANTIRLTIYARRLMIRTMKLVGATDRFIRQPFIVEGLMQGMIAGLLAGLLLVLLIQIATASVVPMLRPGFGASILTVIGLTAVGALLGWVGSMVAVRRFISKVSLH